MGLSACLPALLRLPCSALPCSACLALSARTACLAARLVLPAWTVCCLPHTTLPGLPCRAHPALPCTTVALPGFGARRPPLLTPRLFLAVSPGPGPRCLQGLRRPWRWSSPQQLQSARPPSSSWPAFAARGARLPGLGPRHIALCGTVRSPGNPGGPTQRPPPGRGGAVDVSSFPFLFFFSSTLAPSIPRKAASSYLGYFGDDGLAMLASALFSESPSFTTL